MKVYRNIREISRKDKMGRRFSLTGLGILVFGMMMSFVPTMYPPEQPAPPGAIANFLYHYWPTLSLLALPLGFLAATAGSYFINRFARRRWPNSKIVERPDQVIERNLKGIDDKYAYFAFSLPVSYLLSTPFGLVNFAVRNDRGKVVVNGEKWREPFSFMRFFTLFAREGIGNPPDELVDQEKRLRAFLQKAERNINEGNSNDGTNNATSETKTSALADIPISSAVVFVNDSMELDLTNPTVPVLRPSQLKDHLRRRSKEMRLNPATLKALNEVLEKNAVYQEEEE